MDSCRFSILICAIALCTTGVREGVCQPQRPRVLVSTREVRIMFPTEPGRVWSWPAREDSTYLVAYGWGATVPGMDGPRSLVLQVWTRSRSARRFADLRELVAAGQAAVCEPGMMITCRPGIDASVEGDRVVLALRDRQLIRTLFVMRPAKLRAWRPGPAVSSFAYDSIPVEYVSPMIAEPDAAVRAEAARRKRAYEDGISSISRFIQIRSDYRASRAWVAMDDSVALHVGEKHCTFDVCGATTISVPGARWTVDDSSLAEIRVGPAATGARAFIDGPGPVTRLVGRTPGRVTVRARIPSIPSDTLPSDTPPEHELALDVIVTLPIRAVTIEPRTSSVQVGEHVDFRLTVTDTSSRIVPGLPTELQVTGGAYPYSSNGPGPFAVLFDKPGPWRLVGRLGAHADTVDVTVTPRKP